MVYNPALDFNLTWVGNVTRGLEAGAQATVASNPAGITIPIIPLVIPALITLVIVRPYDTVKAGLIAFPVYLMFMIFKVTPVGWGTSVTLIIYLAWFLVAVINHHSVHTFIMNTEKWQLMQARRVGKIERSKFMQSRPDMIEKANIMLSTRHEIEERLKRMSARGDQAAHIFGQKEGVDSLLDPIGIKKGIQKLQRSNVVINEPDFESRAPIPKRKRKLLQKNNLKALEDLFKEGK